MKPLVAVTGASSGIGEAIARRFANEDHPLLLMARRVPSIPLVPTGGVSAETAGDWIRAGGVAVGMGSLLIGDGEPAGIASRARQVTTAVQSS